MPDAIHIKQVERRLLELACPEKILREKVRELSEHHDDLKQTALEDGLSATEAEERANQLLGNPVGLAEHLAAALRHSSWWGRHPILGFCIFPPFTILFIFAIGLWVNRFFGRLYFTDDQMTVLTDSPEGFALVNGSIKIAYFAGIILTAILFCRLSRRVLSGIKWGITACLVCALNGALLFLWVTPHNLSVGYGTRPNWVEAIIPLLIGLTAWWKLRSAVARVEPVPEDIFRQRNEGQISIARPRRINPTSIITVVITAAIAVTAILALVATRQSMAENRKLRSTIWPKERDAVMEHIATRRKLKETTHETAVDLSSHVNMGFADLFNSQSDAQGNNLAGFPAGLNIFGGVPFSVSGRVQLFGRTMADFKEQFPVRIKGIQIRRTCQKMYLLHGAAWVDEANMPEAIARLVLHYENGSKAEITINAHEHLLNWRGPIYMTSNQDILPETASSATELAWVGGNEWLKKNRPNESLRIYRTAFQNPHPELRVVSADYISTLTKSAPFLLGMTVE